MMLGYISFEKDDYDYVADLDPDKPSSLWSSNNEYHACKTENGYSKNEIRQESNEQINNAQIIWGD